MRTLVYVASHPDDEAISSGGVLLKARDCGYEIHLIWATRGQGSTSARASLRWEEALTVARHLDARCTALGMSDGELKLPTVISTVEKCLRNLKPTVVIWPHGESPEQHQDHRVLHEAMLNICKRSPYGVSSWLAAQPPVFNDPHFEPTLFVPLGRSQMEEVAALTAVYGSEKGKVFVRKDFGSARLQQWAMDARTGTSYAEPYQLIKGPAPQDLFFSRRVDCYADEAGVPVVDAIDSWEAKPQENGVDLLDFFKQASDLTGAVTQVTEHLWALLDPRESPNEQQVRFLYFVDPYDHFVLLDATFGPPKLEAIELQRADERRKNWMKMLEQSAGLQFGTLETGTPSVRVVT